MVISHNMSAINTYNKMGISAKGTNKSMERLSSGYKINKAADDAAGLSISEKMRSQIRGLNQASENAQNGISMIQTAEGALNEAHSILQRMRELAVQAANDTNADTDREALQGEIDQLTGEINRIGNTTEFNGMKLLNGTKIKIEGDEKIEVTKEGTITNIEKGTPGTSNGAKLEFLNGGIKFDAANAAAKNGLQFNNLSPADGDNVLEIGKENGKLYLNLKMKDLAGNAVDTGKTALRTDDATGNWIYDDNGVSFIITKESAHKFLTNGKEGQTAKININKAGTHIDHKDAVDANPAAGINAEPEVPEHIEIDNTIAFKNEYEAETSDYGKIENVKIGAYAGGTKTDYDNVEISFTNADTTGSYELTVKYFNDGVEVLQTTKKGTGLGKLTATNNTVKFDENGLSFNLALDKGFEASDKVHIRLNVDDKLGTVYSVSNTTPVDNSVYFHVGANTNQVINTTFGDMRAHALGLTGHGDGFRDEFSVNNGTDSTPTEKGLNISTREGANFAIEKIDSAIERLSAERSKYGAIQNRLEYTINNVDTTAENMTNAESTIRDTDMAEEMMEMTKNNILQQASQAMLTQAMQRPQQVLQLLQG